MEIKIATVCVTLSKIFVIVGLVMSLFGLILMMESKTTRQNGKIFSDSHVPTKPKLYWFALVLTIIGYILQILGVLFA